jgi:hypothetical protein
VHAASAEAADTAVAAVQAAYRLADAAPRLRPVVAGRVTLGGSPDIAEESQPAVAEGQAS